jgi:hypothetical protein
VSKHALPNELFNSPLSTARVNARIASSASYLEDFIDG